MNPFVATILVRVGLVLVIAVIVAVVLILLGTFSSQDAKIAEQITQDCDTTICCKDCPAIKVSRIIDGDTFDSSAGRVRLYGVDTPERGERCFSEATDRLRELVGGSVTVETGPRLRDPFQRNLYYIYTRSGESIDEKLVREGFGRAWTRDGQHREVLVRLEQQVRQEGVGCLW